MALLSARKEQYSHWVILGTMTCSLLEAHENLSCQTVKSEPAFTNVFQNWLTAVYCCKRETEGKKEQLRKLNHCQDIDWHLAGEESEQMKKFYCCIVNEREANKCIFNMREVNTMGRPWYPEGPDGKPKQSQLWLFVISIMHLDAPTHPAGGERHLQASVLIDKAGLTVTVATVAFHAWWPGRSLSFNSVLMSGPRVGDDRHGWRRRRRIIKNHWWTENDHSCRLKSY